ncbi:formimidoylglutamase [Sphingobacterium puteale]|uniref:Formimidoylglutamase n=1 Tax=Sphingobacterium puteale TaxID=2420510 RepID=A0A420VY41_9SPHI|nr:formimidoylglutamase [Sphingobacterium puteale]RKO71117.1 formimidoylglutamase [Sphingobacterium puteale]
MDPLFNHKDLYVPGDQAVWKGRVDGEERDWMRWHQLVDCIDLSADSNLSQSLVFLGFCSDEGVGRNQGRVGAKDGPSAIRNVLANLPAHFSCELKLKDAGDIMLTDNDLESSQFTLGNALSSILKGGGFPVVLGGGHEVTYGHYLGVKRFLDDRKYRIGIINIDAHLDMRETSTGQGNSGTGFFQIERDLSNQGQSFHYLAIGIQEISNTRGLIAYAKSKHTQIIERKDVVADRLDALRRQVRDFAGQVDYVYLTIDLDAFAAPYAPGVSALAFNGIVPDELFFDLYSAIIELPNLRSMDIAELNPYFDIDARTAKLGAYLIFKLLERF